MAYVSALEVIDETAFAVLNMTHKISGHYTRSSGVWQRVVDFVDGQNLEGLFGTTTNCPSMAPSTWVRWSIVQLGYHVDRPPGSGPGVGSSNPLAPIMVFNEISDPSGSSFSAPYVKS